MSEENNGIENNAPVSQTPEETPDRPKRGRPRKLNPDGTPVRRGRPPKKKEEAPAEQPQAVQTVPEEQAPAAASEAPIPEKKRPGRRKAVMPQEPPVTTSAAVEQPQNTVEQRELDFVPVPVPGEPDMEYVPAAPEAAQNNDPAPRKEALMPREELPEYDDPREYRDRNNRNNRQGNNNNN